MNFLVRYIYNWYQHLVHDCVPVIIKYYEWKYFIVFFSRPFDAHPFFVIKSCWNWFDDLHSKWTMWIYTWWGPIYQLKVFNVFYLDPITYFFHVSQWKPILIFSQQNFQCHTINNLHFSDDWTTSSACFIWMTI